jgi:long-chain acyl-CoA synthetase
MEPQRVSFKDWINSLPPRISHVVRPWAQRTPDAVALSEGDRKVLYGDLVGHIESTGRWLREQGVRPGDRVMIVGENSIALALFVLATGEIDAWPLVSNARISAREIDGIHAHSGARLTLFTTAVSADAAEHAKRLEAAASDIPGIGRFAVGKLNRDAMAEVVMQGGAQQVGALIYTSGTTGSPKGVMLSHRNVLFAAAIGGTLRDMTQDDKVYGVLPMSHIVGFSTGLTTTLMFGACLELVPKFEASTCLAALREGGITRFQGVPTMYQRLLEISGGPIACPALKSIGVAGAPLEPPLKAAVEKAFGLPLHNGYGITECAPTISTTRMDEPPRDTTVGKPIPSVEVRLVDASGKRAADGAVGELHVRGPNVMLGYYRAPDLTAAVIDADGWFNTGDLARFDGENLYIAGRTKELIIRSGFNVYPPEVEAVLASHPAVANCAVVGRKVPGNEEVVAIIKLPAGASATSREIIDFAAERLAPYKRPAEVFVRASLPATSAGKILKHQLAKEANQNEH